MTKYIVRKGGSFAAVRSEWKRLSARCDLSPFLSWEWMSTWFDNFGGGRTPMILQIFENNELVGILPMLQAATSLFGIRAVRWSMMGEGFGGADHLDVVASSIDRSKIAVAISEFLSKDRSVDQIEFASVDTDSTLNDILKRVETSPGTCLPRYVETDFDVCPQLSLVEGWHAVLANCKRKTNFRRRLNKIQQMAGSEFRSVTSPSAVEAAFERFLHLHQTRWAAYGGSELTGHRRLVDFHRVLVPKLADAGLVRFDELWTDGECRGSVYGLDNGKTFYLLNSGYDLEFSHLSIGLVLLGLSIKHAIERGNTTYDFLRGNESYKFDWADRTEKLVNVSLSRNSMKMVTRVTLEHATKQMLRIARSSLPAVVAEPIANWRRTWKRNYKLAAR